MKVTLFLTYVLGLGFIIYYSNNVFPISGPMILTQPAQITDNSPRTIDGRPSQKLESGELKYNPLRPAFTDPSHNF